MSPAKIDNIFIKMHETVDELIRDSFLTIDDGYFFNLHLLILRSLYIRLDKAIKLNLLEYDDEFYKHLFIFGTNKSEYPFVPQNDPFYPLLEQIKNFLTDLVSYKDYYETIFKKNEQPSMPEPRLLNNVIRYRKLFLKDVTELVCDKYTIKLKNIETRVVVDRKLKAIIDDVFFREIEGQQILLFDDLEEDTKATNDYVESCRYLKILKNPVNKFCTIFTDESVNNKTQMDLLNHYVQGCSENLSAITSETTLEALPTKPRDPYNDISRHQRSLLSLNKPKKTSENINSYVLSSGGLFCIFSSLVILMLLLKKFLWK